MIPSPAVAMKMFSDPTFRKVSVGLSPIKPGRVADCFSRNFLMHFSE
jgi:hypothetical protein